MQKQLTGYTLDPKGYEIIFDKSQILNDMHLTGQVGYESSQVFDGTDIVKYKSIVITGSNEDRINYVSEIYGLNPSYTVKNNDEVHAVFILSNNLVVDKYNILGKRLSYLYGGSYQHFSFFSGRDGILKDNSYKIADVDVLKLLDFRQLTDSVNEFTEQIFNDIPIKEIAKKIKYSGKIDEVLNIIPVIGSCFNLVYSVLGSVHNAMVWCNKHFDIGFITDKAETSLYLTDGINGTHTSIVERADGYSMDTSKGLAKITDFTIKIHYKIIKPDGENVFVVTLIPKDGKKVEYIEWKNVTSDTSVGDFLMKYGAFHIGGGKSAVKALHEMITASNVPVIKTIPQYGHYIYKGSEIIVGYDGIFDMKTKRFFPKNEEYGFYFIGGNDGLIISSESEAGKIQPEFIPRIMKSDSTTYEDYLTIFKSIYKNYTADVLLMMACSMAGVSLYHTGNKTPSYYVTGVTGTGKSSFAEALYTMFGVKEAYGLRNSTVYPVKTNISSFNRFPIFFNELRAGMRYADEKLGLIQMAYDNSTTSKGLRNGGTLTYKMTSQVFCEGEDTYSEGSIRTRSILHTLTKAGVTKGCVPKEVINDYRQELESFFGNYMTHTDKESYNAALMEAREIFYLGNVEPRISDNISIMYAGCVCFCPSMKDRIKEVCLQLVDEQMQDFNENGESQKMYKILSEYYGSRFCNVITEFNYLYIDWVEIVGFIDRYKRNLTLSIDAYKGHMEALGFEKGFFEVQCPTEEYGTFATKQYKLINGFRMPLTNLNKMLLNNPKIYSAYRIAVNTSK